MKLKQSWDEIPRLSLPNCLRFFIFSWNNRTCGSSRSYGWLVIVSSVFSIGTGGLEVWDIYIIRKVSRICFWAARTSDSETLPFYLQVIVVISWLRSTLCSHKRKRQSEFPHDQVPKRWGPLFKISYRPGFPAPLCFSDLSTRAIYHGPRRKLVFVERIRPGNSIQWYILKVRISSRLRAPMDDHILIVVYSIPVKCQKSKE